MARHLESAARRYAFAKDRRLLTYGLGSGLLFWAAFSDHNDGFYTFLRIYVCGLSLAAAYLFHAEDRPAWALATLCSAILFNPLLPVQLDRSTWQILDFVAASLFGGLGLQRYSTFKQNKWIPLAPAAVVSAVALITLFDWNSLSAGSSNLINVDENLTTTDMNAADVTLTPVRGNPFEDLIPKNDRSEHVSAENVIPAPEETNPSPLTQNDQKSASDWLNTRPDGSTAPKPDMNEFQRTADRVRAITSGGNTASNLDNQLETNISED